MKEIIIKLFGKCKTLRGRYREIKKYEKDIIQYTNWLEPYASLQQRIYHIINNINYIPLCINCSIKKVNFNNNKNIYNNYCSIKCSSNNSSTKKKRKETNLIKYGTEHALQNENIRKKIESTNLIKYGAKNVFSNYDIKEKIKLTNIKRYGVENPSQSDEIKQKKTNTSKIKYDIEVPNQRHNKEGFALLNNKKWLDENYNNKSVKEISNILGICQSVINLKLNYFNITIKRKDRSYEEKQLTDWLKCINVNYIINDRNIIKPKELDIYIPGNNLAIEFNGEYWHSDVHVNHDYHLNKTNLCESNDIQLLHIFESEWVEKQDIWKSVILSKLGLIKDKIYGRNTEIRNVSVLDGFNFFNNNHLQGGLFIGEHIGLFYDNELVCCISYGKSRFEKDTLEIYRFANKLNTTVCGGFQKLLKLLPKPIISYANRRWSNGNLYTKAGFEFVHDTKPNYYYYKRILESRHQFQKHKLKNMKFYDEKLTEKEIMKLNGYHIVYDCGSKKYILNY